MDQSVTNRSEQWQDVWRSAFRILEKDESINPQQIMLWIEPLHVISVTEKDHSLEVLLGAQNDFSAQWVRDHYINQLETAFAQVTGNECLLKVEVGPRDGMALLSPERIAPTPKPNPQNQKDQNQRSSLNAVSGKSMENGPLWGVASKSIGSSSVFDPKYTFETFVVGASNQFAHASAYAVSENPARQYNPLFLYSSPGLGKTHLLHAIANHVLGKNPNFRVLYISAERFVNELIESIQHNKMSQFRSRYRDSYDVILFDDIQFIAGKEKTEEEFFHTFNALHSSKRQIVVTSDRPPKEIEGLEERLRTRFEWGLIADITPPEIETRIAILKAKAERDDIYLPDDVATFIATYVKSNVRELEGVLIKLQAHASLTGSELSLDLAKQQLRFVVPDQSSNYTIESIQSAVAKHYKLKGSDFKSNSKLRSIARPRQIAMYLIRKYTTLGFKEIGNYFGGRDHTTIMHACREIEKKMDHDHDIKEAVESIQNLL
jgi:chromosomal replication initiator protein